MKTAAQIRQEFLDFFREKDHKIVPSSPVIPSDDPTLLFTNAGMNQFKDVFLGAGTRDYNRAADTQKCIRVSGKHNDLEEVGWDTYHHTFFEMLGNWSFGDYFKEEAIQWAWELLVEKWGLDDEKLYATVFGGDDSEGLPVDQEAEDLWVKLTDLPPERVLRFGKEDNFWEMGATGPCGPCTEIHLDQGAETCDKKDIEGHTCQVNGGCARYIEIWNLVFIQFNRAESGKLKPLPAQHVDTGMGFERIVAVMQDKTSNYDTDLFAPIFEELTSIVEKDYGRDFQTDVAFRVIADHVRTLCTAFADGALPGNSGRGYVLRRILRRASRYGRQTLLVSEPFIYRLVDTVADIYKDVFPEIHERRDHIKLLVKSEEEAFGRTLDKGISLFEELVDKIKKDGREVIPGDEAYDLFSTYGFPRDLIELMAREENMSIDEEGWAKAEEEHKSRSESEHSYEYDVSELEGLPPTEFTGYSRDTEGREVEASIVKLLGTSHLVLSRTPFYPEGGGQVGDQGVIEGDNFRFEVSDTQKVGDVIVHTGELEEGDLSSLPETVRARIDYERRKDIMANHTATHLLHWALKEIFGDSANQAGSLVAPDRLRFDVTVPQKITDSEIKDIEDMINKRIVENREVAFAIEDLEEAKKKGAMALFGEKYDEKVRTVGIGDFSLELCGGTHCQATGEIGSFAITSESSLQTGVRRIEAVTRMEAVKFLQKNRDQIWELSQSLSVPAEEVTHRVEKLTEDIKELKKKRKKSSQVDAASQAKALFEGAEKVGETSVIAAEIDCSGPRDLQLIADHFAGYNKPVVAFLATSQEGKVQLLSMMSKDLIGDGFNAPEIMKEVAPLVDGRGGGRPDRAQGGGTNPEGLTQALEKARSFMAEKLA